MNEELIKLVETTSLSAILLENVPSASEWNAVAPFFREFIEYNPTRMLTEEVSWMMMDVFHLSS